MMMEIPTTILRTFKHQKVDRIIWQPSIMYWYNINRVHRLNETSYQEVKAYVPENYIGMEILDLYRDMKGSLRYPHETLDLSSFYSEFVADANISNRLIIAEDESRVTVMKSPVGTLSKKTKYGFPIEHYVKKIEDLDVIEYVLEHTEYKFNPYAFEIAQEAIEDLGVVQMCNFRSPYQRCVIEFLGFITTTKFLRKYPRRMETFMEKLEIWDDKAYKVIEDSPMKIISFGENLHAKIAPPPIFTKYHLPYYKKRVKRLHARGKFCHIHFDGDVEDLLPFIPEMPFDGIEAVTFKPQGDITPEEWRDVAGKKILLDGIPAVYFLPEFPEKQLLEFVEKLIELFSPNLILGISDELCPTMDGRRLKLVGDFIEKVNS
ncbi:MAG: hypothetical protein ACTSU9_19900 [Promethearchaeota archaeon]